MENPEWITLRFSVIVFIFIILLNCNPVSQKNQPKAVQGIMDLREWDFEKDGILELDGEWEFYWKEIISPAQFSNSENCKSQKQCLSGFSEKKKFIQVPRPWNGFDANEADESQKIISGDGFATYRLKILTVKPFTLALKTGTFATAYILYLNGVRTSSAGEVGENQITSKPKYSPRIILLPNVKSEMEIVIHVSNFHHKKGGMWNSIQLGLENEIHDLRERNIFVDIFLTGSFLVMGFYHLGLFTIRKKDRSTLYFGLFCICISIFTMVNGEMYLYKMFPGMPFALSLKLDHLAVYLCPPFAILFISRIFPDETNKIICGSVVYLTFVLAFLVLILPTGVFTHIMPVIEIIILASCLYSVYIAIVASIHNRQGAKSFLLGIGVFFIIALNDVLFENHIIATGFFTPFGLFFVIFLQSFVLSMRFSRAFLISENLTIDLERNNKELSELKDSLEIKVEERTEQLEKAKIFAEEEHRKSESLLFTIRKDLQVARKIQRTILPRLLDIRYLNINTKYMPMTEVGGDIYNIEELRPGFVRIFIADATGHGMQAALVTMCILAEYQHIRKYEIPPSELLGLLNSQFCRNYNFLKSFFTCFLVDVDLGTNRICFASAGHPPQVLLGKTGMELLHRTGPLVGIKENAIFKLNEKEFQNGDKLFLFTDGIFEEFNSIKEEFGEERLYSLIREYGKDSLESSMEKILAELDEFLNGYEKQDDITFLGISHL
ncbi:MAG: SpoIIE family protein phosphatase [Leptospira sp.]|nr:SpoIIE family protein phosphatase [Leptospira sp.]